MDFSDPTTSKGLECVSVDTLNVSETQDGIYNVDIEIIGHCIEKMRVKVCPTRSKIGCEEYLLPAGEKIKTRLYTKSKASLVTYNWDFYDTPTATTSSANGPNWNYIDASYIGADIGSFEQDIDADGFGASVSTLIGESIIFNLSYSYISEDNVFNENVDGKITNGTLGIGYRYAATSSTDVFIIASYLYYELELKGLNNRGSIDDNGYGITLGVRSMLTESFEGTITLGYAEIDDESETAIGISTHYHINKVFAVGVSYSVADDADQYGIGVRVSF